MLTLAEGQVIFYGYRTEAKKYFEDLGFDCLGKSPSAVQSIDPRVETDAHSLTFQMAPTSPIS